MQNWLGESLVGWDGDPRYHFIRPYSNVGQPSQVSHSGNAAFAIFRWHSEPELQFSVPRVMRITFSLFPCMLECRIHARPECLDPGCLLIEDNMTLVIGI